MKKLLFLFILACAGTMTAQSTWKADPMHSKLAFAVTHLGIADISGSFKSFDLSVTGAKADFSDAVFDLTVDVASINTQVDPRDEHLRSADFFDTAKYPKMTFKSTGVKMVSKDKYEVTGNLTMHGTTKPIKLQFWYRGTVENPQSKALTAGFQVTGSLNRADFGIGTKFPPPMISNEISIKADGELTKQ
jgi:polyisoprenoid-binding protein YceI